MKAKRRHAKRRDPGRDKNRLDRLNRVLEKLALSLAGGFLLGLPFLRPALSFLHWVALIPWILLFAHPRYRARALYISPGAFTYLFMSLGPYSAFTLLLPLAIAGESFLAFLVFPLFLRWLLRAETPLAIATPLVWVVTEWFRVIVSCGQLEMYLLGTSQAGLTHLIQIADLTGVYGVSFVIAAVNGAFADLLIAGHDRPVIRRWIAVGFAAVVLGASLGYGLFRINQARFQNGPRFALVQPNEVHYHNPEKNRDLVARQIDLTRRTVPVGSADVVVWPENAVDDRLNLRSDYVAALQSLSAELGAPVLSGAFTGFDDHNYTTSAYLLSPGSVERYDKVHMIFLAEYMPLSGLFRDSPALRRLESRFARLILRQAGGARPAKDVKVFEVGRARFAAPICFEITSSDWARQATRRGADILINITSEGVLGTPTYRHLWALGTFRAVENRVSVLRAANNGLSGFVDPAGRTQKIIRGVQSGAPYFEAGAVIDAARIDPRRGTSFYSRNGNFFVLLCAALIAVLTLRSKLTMSARERVANPELVR
jgi:apolipoprotein N-acyltransferase